MQIVYEDITLMDLKVAGPPWAYGSEIYIMQIQLDTVLIWKPLIKIFTWWILILKLLAPLTSFKFRNVHYVNTIGHCIIAKTVYEDINLMDLEAAGPPPAHSSKTWQFPQSGSQPSGCPFADGLCWIGQIQLPGTWADLPVIAKGIKYCYQMLNICDRNLCLY